MTDRRHPYGLGDNLAELFGEAVGDIRRHLVEEAWFGRPLSAPDRPSYIELVTSLYGEKRAPEVVEHERGRSVEIDR